MTQYITDVPGIHSRGHSSTIRFAQMAANMYGLEHNHPDLPKRWAVGVWFFFWRDVRLVANVLRDQDMMVCHSYGCLRGTQGLIRFQKKNPGKYVKLLFLIAPAMKEEFDFSQIDERTTIVCLHSTDDAAIKAGTIIPLHRFGDAGLHGFKDCRVNNVSCEPSDHNDYFNMDIINEHIETFAHHGGLVAPDRV